MDTILFTSAALLAAYLAFLFLRPRTSRDPPKKLPPGPPPHFLVGHTFQVPQTKPWLYFDDLGKKYGPVIRLSLAGDDVLVLNDARDAEELLGRRSANYSSRKPLVYAGRHQSKDKRLVLLSYGEELRKQRAAFHAMLQPRVVDSYETAQERESLRLLRYTLDKPSESHLNAKRYAASVVYTLTYGKDLDIDGGDDLSAILSIVEGFVQDCYPGSHLVDTFPILDFLPGFLAPWRKQAFAKHDFEMKLYNRLVLEAKTKKAGLANTADCFASRLWEDNDKLKLDMVSLSYVAGSAVEAGTDTTAATVLWFFMAVIIYPETFKRAQEEIDRVVGADGSTMPTFKNMNDLPYCFALTKEIFRWMPSAPGGFPHYSDRDDEYNGYFIRGKTMVIPNIWSMHRNETDFPDSAKFMPERYLKDIVYPIKSTALTEGHYGFGFGRRGCPGKYLAGQTIWIALVRLMWGFNITNARDENGRIIRPDVNHSSNGITSKPEEFPFQIAPRSSTHEETMRREMNDVFG